MEASKSDSPNSEVSENFHETWQTAMLRAITDLTDNVNNLSKRIDRVEQQNNMSNSTPLVTPPGGQEVHTSEFGLKSSRRDSRKSGSSSSSSDEELASNRRPSLLRPVALLRDKHAVVTTIQNQPSFEHIRLNQLTVKDAFKFWSEVNKYEQMYGIPLKPATLVGDRVKKTLMTKNRDRIVDDACFYKLESSHLRKYIQKAIRPTDRLMFASQLSDALSFWTPDSFTLSILNFQDFFTRLCTYRRDFEEVYDFLAYHNKDNIPRLDNKDNGLVKIFLSKIPTEYGNNVLHQLSKTKFDNLTDFFDSFYEYANSHYDIAKESRKLISFLQTGGNTNAAPSKHFTKRGNRLHRMEHSAPHVDVDTFDADAEADLPTDIPSVDNRMVVKDSHETDDEISVIKRLDIPTSSEQQLHLLKRNQPIHTKSSAHDILSRKQQVSEPNGCFKMLVNGRCDRPQCTFSHDVNVLEATAAMLENRIRLRPFKAKLEQLASFPSRAPPKPPIDTSKVHALTRIDIDDNLSDYASDTQLSMLHHISSESSLVNAVTHNAILVVNDNANTKVNCLLDSGALHASYIRKSIVDEMRSNCEHQIKSCTGSVLLADKQTSIPVTELLHCKLYMTSPSGNEFFISQVLIVMEDLGEDVIIGLPTIVSSLLSLYTEKLQQAADTIASSSLHSMIDQPWTIIEDDAPEDIDTPMPCAFPSAIHFLSISRQDAIEEMYNQIEEHIAPEFRAATDVVNLIKTLGVEVFIPTKWEGVKGVPPIEFNWKQGLPEKMKPNPRPLNPKLYENAKIEFERLRTYFYVPSDSPIASCLVIAPKATKPFIRFCGDYATLVNKYIETGHYPIPHVFRSLEKITKYPIFLDIDLTNSFHQFVLGTKTRRLLSVQTPWGQFEPLFLPEGVPPASGILQQTMMEIFSDFEEWTIAIFDNLLVLCHDYADAYHKLEKVLHRCKERNVVLKFSKSWLGFKQVEFFGYQCSHLKYCLTEKRKNSIMEMPFPTTQKGMMRFLGCALFFNKFMPNYAELTAQLHDMTRKNFIWNSSAWEVDYEGYFVKFKEELLKATALFYPDYELDWILRVDASDVGVGFVLLQIFVGTIDTPESERSYQPILFGGKKFSDQAMKWDTYNKEAFALFYGIKSCEYYLRGKHFTLEGDHRNLQWIEKSVVPKVIRWRIYMQGFSFDFNHIQGRKNIVADWRSRLFFIITPLSASTLAATSSETELVTQDQMLHAVHGGRSAHMGARTTWMLLNKHYPGHNLSYAQVAEFVSMCPVCQKVRLSMKETLIPVVRHLKNDGPRRVVGIDYLSISEDKFGNIGCYVARDHHTKLIFIYPTKAQSALLAATTLFLFCVTYGVFEYLMSDPGTEFTSDIVALLNSWFGIHHRISLTDRHESNGVEGGNKEILRHLRTLLCDERIKDRWSDATVIGWVTFIMNTFNDSESGASPYALTFGSDSVRAFDFPVEPLNSTSAPAFLKQLDDDLRILREKALAHQHNIVRKRCDSTTKQNVFQPGDFVLFHHPSDKPLPSKLSGNYAGPYEVLNQVKNDVQCKHCALHKIVTFHVGNLKLFCGSRADANRIAMADSDQFEIDTFLAYRGDPMVRTTMEFLIRFKDGTEHWIPWNEDIFSTVPYELFCRQNSALVPLLYRLDDTKQRIREINKTPITEVYPGLIVYVDLRCYGASWYQSLPLPDVDLVTYVVIYQYGKISKNMLKIVAHCPIFNERFEVNHWFVKQYGSNTICKPDWVLIDETFISQYPCVLPLH